MTPPISYSTRPTVVPIGHPDPEWLNDLSFDELRELPVAMQLGLDLTAIENPDLD